MQKNIYYIITIAILVSGCAAKKNIIASKHNVPTRISYSTGFDNFMTTLKMEMQGINSWDDYIPSNTMLQEFDIIIMPDSSVGVQGFIQVIPEIFDAYTFESMEGYLVYFSQGLFHYKIPIKNIRAMLEIKGIVQVDIAQKHKKKSSEISE